MRRATMDKFQARTFITPAQAAAAMAGRPRADESAYEYYRRTYRDMPYFSSGRNWADYAPAYRYALERAAALYLLPDSFGAIEARLRQGWEDARDGSRLTWAEARGAVRHVFDDARTARVRRRV